MLSKIDKDHVSGLEIDLIDSTDEVIGEYSDKDISIDVIGDYIFFVIDVDNPENVDGFIVDYSTFHIEVNRLMAPHITYDSDYGTDGKPKGDTDHANDRILINDSYDPFVSEWTTERVI